MFVVPVVGVHPDSGVDHARFQEEAEVFCISRFAWGLEPQSRVIVTRMGWTYSECLPGASHPFLLKSRWVYLLRIALGGVLKSTSSTV